MNNISKYIEKYIQKLGEDWYNEYLYHPMSFIFKAGLFFIFCMIILSLLIGRN